MAGITPAQLTGLVFGDPFVRRVQRLPPRPASKVTEKHPPDNPNRVEVEQSYQRVLALRHRRSIALLINLYRI